MGMSSHLAFSQVEQKSNLTKNRANKNQRGKLPVTDPNNRILLKGDKI